MDEEKLREEIIRYGRKLAEYRLIQATWGNISARLDSRSFLITPSGVDYERIRPEDIVKVNILDGSYDPALHPSSERVMHQLIYRKRPDIKAVIHTHSGSLAVFAACRQDLITETLEIPCTAYAVSGSKRLAKHVSDIMSGHTSCIIANHGFVTGARDLETALRQAAEAEKAAGEVLGV